MILKIAWKNYCGRGLRAFLNILVVALTLIAIIFNLSILNGFQAQMTRNMVSTNVAGGHYRVPGFDLLTPTEWEDFTLPTPEPLRLLPPEEKAEVLILQGQIFPNSRLFPIQLRGLEMEQALLDLPMHGLKPFAKNFGDTIPVILGTKMAEKAHLKKGDTVILKWRDRFGAVDAQDIKVIEVVHLVNPRIDDGVVWLRLDHLRAMTRRANEVSWVAVKKSEGGVEGLEFHSPNRLMRDLLTMLKHDRRNSKILWTILIFLAGISIFNTQILSVFKRQKEIGALMALGMDAKRIMWMFTLEGGFAALGAVLLAALLGAPFFTWFQGVGIDVSHLSETTIPIRENIFLDIRPVEVCFTVGVVVAIMILVAWLPVRKITRLDPTLALRGRAIT